MDEKNRGQKKIGKKKREQKLEKGQKKNSIWKNE